MRIRMLIVDNLLKERFKIGETTSINIFLF